MPDLRPPARITGLVLLFMGAAMLVPMALDYTSGDANGGAFLESSLVTVFAGSLISVATMGTSTEFSIRQAYILTAGLWIGSILFCSLPFMLGAPHLDPTNAPFEATSGITTTGSSVIPKVETMPPGFLLWRGMLNWFGGLGIAFVVMIFFPFLRVGGMRFFKTEGFDTIGKILPRATDIARLLIVVYAGLTAACAATYSAFGMTSLDAIVNAMATVATGGFSTADASFGKYHGAVEYAGAFFMVVSSLPYIRFVQLLRGQTRLLRDDQQIPAYLGVIAVAVASVAMWRWVHEDIGFEPILRGTLFNLVSIISCTGFATDNVAAWGSLAVVVAMAIGLVGGCTSSSSGSISVFRWQIFFAALFDQVRRFITQAAWASCAMRSGASRTR